LYIGITGSIEKVWGELEEREDLSRVMQAHADIMKFVLKMATSHPKWAAALPSSRNLLGIILARPKHMSGRLTRLDIHELIIGEILNHFGYPLVGKGQVFFGREIKR